MSTDKSVMECYTHSLNLALNVISHIAYRAAKLSKKRVVNFKWPFNNMEVSLVVTFKEKSNGKVD